MSLISERSSPTSPILPRGNHGGRAGDVGRQRAGGKFISQIGVSIAGAWFRTRCRSSSRATGVPRDGMADRAALPRHGAGHGSRPRRLRRELRPHLALVREGGGAARTPFPRGAPREPLPATRKPKARAAGSSPGSPRHGPRERRGARRARRPATIPASPGSKRRRRRASRAGRGPNGSSPRAPSPSRAWSLRRPSSSSRTFC